MTAKRKPPSHYDHGESAWDSSRQSFEDWLREDLYAPIAREVLTIEDREDRERRGRTAEPEWP